MFYPACKENNCNTCIGSPAITHAELRFGAIAGNAIAAGCILVANNTKEFKQVPV